MKHKPGMRKKKTSKKKEEISTTLSHLGGGFFLLFMSRVSHSFDLFSVFVNSLRVFCQACNSIPFLANMTWMDDRNRQIDENPNQNKLCARVDGRLMIQDSYQGHATSAKDTGHSRTDSKIPFEYTERDRSERLLRPM
jgi:hypothetical protein